MIDLYRDDPDNLFSLDFVIGQGAQARCRCRRCISMGAN